jgi:hypothetical protein
LVARELEGLVSRQALEVLARSARQSGQLQIERLGESGRIAPRAWRRAAPEARTLTALARMRGPELSPRFVDWEGAAFAWQNAGDPLVLGVPWAHLPALFSAAKNNDVTRLIPKPGGAQPVLNSLDQLQSPQTFKAIDPVALGTQALNDKGRKGGPKDGSHKPPMQLQNFDVDRRLIPKPHAPPRRTGPPRRFVGLVIGIIIVVIIVIGGFFALRTARGVGRTASVLLNEAPTDTPTRIPQGLPAMVVPSDTPTPVEQCVPAPVLGYPADGAIRSGNTLLRWTTSAPLVPGENFAVLASTHPEDLQGVGAQADIVGTSSSDSLALDFTTWKYAGRVGTFFWIVRVQGGEGQFIDCAGAPPRSFRVASAAQATKVPKDSSGADAGGGGGRP